MIAAMAMPRKKQKKTAHGGRREGAGRPPLPEGHTSIVSVTLSGPHIEKVERWQDQHECATFSEALRQMIDAAGA